MEAIGAYAVLKIIWWVLLGVLFAGLAIMVGMDMGVGIILRFVGRTDMERRMALNIIGPHWDGNQVWFILGGGAIFAAWPAIYSSAFSGLYIVMLVLLWSMIVRPLGFEYRSKLPSEKWRNRWDWALFVSGFVPMLVYGAAFGNVMTGFPFFFAHQGTNISIYTGSFIDLFNPFAILMGLLSVSLSIYMGSMMIFGRSESIDMKERARKFVNWSAWAAMIIFTIGGIWLFFMKGWHLQPVKGFNPNMPANPALNNPGYTVAITKGAWLKNFDSFGILWIIPLIAYVSLLIGLSATKANKFMTGWWAGAFAWIAVLATVATATFPFMFPSSLNPLNSLTVWNASSSEKTLGWMLAWACIFVPAILSYTSWCFWVMRGKVSSKHIENDEHAY